MIFDSTLLLSSAQSLAGAAATTYSTNIIDLGATGAPYGTLPSGSAVGAIARDIGPGAGIPIQAQVVTAFAGGTALIVALEVATDAAFTTPVEVFRSPTYLDATLVAGFKLLPERVPIRTNLRYLRAKYITTGTHTVSTSTVTVGVVPAAQTNA